MTVPKYFSEGRTKHKKSQDQEKRVAKQLDGKVQKGSGSKTFHKGDVKSRELLVESKRTDKDSLSVKKDWLIKIFNESVAYNKIPALSIEFDQMPNLVPKDWIAIPADKLRYFIDCADVLNKETDDD